MTHSALTSLFSSFLPFQLRLADVRRDQRPPLVDVALDRVHVCILVGVLGRHVSLPLARRIESHLASPLLRRPC